MAGMVVVTVSMGVMKPLLAKLAKLMGDEYKMLEGVRKQVAFLQEELTTMSAFLEDLALMDVELDKSDKDWRDRVREMSYDMEDCIDDFMHHFDGGETVFVKKILRRLKTLWTRHQITNQIKDLKARVFEISKRRRRYMFDDLKARAPPVTTVDPRISALFTEAASLVGIDGPMKDLLGWLTDPDQRVKVVSIVGFGGLGKTTLAKQVYDKIGDQFECKAFVSVSQRPDMKRLLTTIQSKLGLWESACKVEDIIENLRCYLKHKRYIIVVDDLWDKDAWNIMRDAFPENSNGSIVIVTTRVRDVATLACGNHQFIYKMRPLSEHDSRRLFLNRIFGSDDDCPSQFGEVSSKILKKCGGLPLAIITISSLLASLPSRIMEEWVSILNSLDAQFGRNNPTLEGMRQILDLSYKNLPLHLRTCLLYLGKYPEDHEIKRDDLVRQWVAEGFVLSNPHGKDLYDVAQTYFYDLINRGLIQPVENIFRDVNFCRVHDMMLDLIMCKCKEDNFMSVPYSYEDYMASQHGYCKDRRLSLNHTKSDWPIINVKSILANLGKIRSFAGNFMEVMVPLSSYKCLRVMDLYLSNTPSTYRFDLTIISQLFQLRYLKVDGDFDHVELPSRIYRLMHLETLEINGFKGVVVPSDVFSLRRLSHLIVPQTKRLPDGIHNMKYLRTLRSFCLQHMDVKVIEALGELTNLRDLHLYSERCPTSVESASITDLQLDALCSSIGKLRNLRNLEIGFGPTLFKDDYRLGSLCDFPSRDIETLDLVLLSISRVPRWINADLHVLCHLELTVQETLSDEVGLLGELPSLILLVLHVDRIPAGLVFGPAIRGPLLFPVLRIFRLIGPASPLVFQAGVMPKLLSLVLRFSCPETCGTTTTPTGMEHLLSLNRMNVSISVTKDRAAAPAPGAYDRDATERAFMDAAQAHPNRPSIKVHFNWFH